MFWTHKLEKVNPIQKSILISFNPFHATGLFRYPLKTFGFLMFPGSIERDQGHAICQSWKSVSKREKMMHQLLLEKLYITELCNLKEYWHKENDGIISTPSAWFEMHTF